MKRWLALTAALVLAPEGWADDKARIDCFPEDGATQQACEARGCAWTPKVGSDPTNMPYCYMKASQIGYTATNMGGNQWTLQKNAGPRSPWLEDTAQLKLSYKEVGNNVINLRIETPNKRYDADDFLKLPRETVAGSGEKLTVTVSNTDPFYFTVSRASGRKIFDTSIGGLIFTDKFIQIATYLPSENMYGWGENIHPNLRHDFTRYTTWAMLARDEPPNSAGLDTKNLYGVHPFYMVVEPDGKAHGVLIVNSNSQDVTTLPAPALVYRTIGGILDINFFPGPTPADVIRQYTAFVGRPFLPAYWALGYQMCRYGYKSLDDMKARVQAVRDYKIPFDVAYADIDYMQRYKDFTVGDNWAGFGDYVSQMHSWGMHAILIFDPAVQADYDSFQRGINSDASFIEWERNDEVMRAIQDQYPMAKDTKVMLGVVWPDRHVAFPDFLDPTGKTDAWWTDEFKRYHNQVPFDGAWIDMNEPAVFGTNEDHPWYYDDSDHPSDLPLKCPTSGDDAVWDMPPYRSAGVYYWGDAKKNAFLASKTLCMRAVTARKSERFYNTKNLYGWSESRSTVKALHEATGKRGAVISRSTFPSSGRYAGHWLGDNTARWEDLRSAEFNLFGIPYVGSDVCGFNGASNEELCLRWQQLGSFHSFFRNHNSKELPYQDPAVWSSVAAASRKANEFRYSLLPYLFSLHFRASLYGDTVIRPVFFEFPTDSETFDLGEQFMWGPALLVAPVIYQGASSVSAYIPSTSFYSLYDDAYGGKVNIGRTTFNAPTKYNSPVFIRGGSIVPRIPSNLTTVAARQGMLNLLIAYDQGAAAGEFFWDDGDSIVADFKTHAYTHASFKFAMQDKGSSLTITTDVARAPSLPVLSYLEIFDYPAQPIYASFTLNGKTLSVNTQASKYSPFSKILTVVFYAPVDISKQGTYEIAWQAGAGSEKLRSNRTHDA